MMRWDLPPVRKLYYVKNEFSFAHRCPSAQGWGMFRHRCVKGDPYCIPAPLFVLVSHHFCEFGFINTCFWPCFIVLLLFTLRNKDIILDKTALTDFLLRAGVS